MSMGLAEMLVNGCEGRDSNIQIQTNATPDGNSLSIQFTVADSDGSNLVTHISLLLPMQDPLISPFKKATPLVHHGRLKVRNLYPDNASLFHCASFLHHPSSFVIMLRCCPFFACVFILQSLGPAMNCIASFSLCVHLLKLMLV